ncbi:MAG: MiaB/RimO family radical SAM methylthiotransferase, partial [Rikenellaceae bacterium]|nr:MiaB/RimO family radical SAM methylthiotransferase [Rikenellaceae bacterium]
PEVDEFFGVKTFDGVLEALGVERKAEVETERVLTTPSHYAYLKIAEGCDRRCGYCAIPLIRGGHVSVPMEQVIEEARKLAARGVREIMVIAQDTTYYGIDLYGKRMLAPLLRELCKVEGIEWIRLHYAYPAGFPADVIEVMRDEPKICKYLDIPLQHISDNQLRSMKRAIDKAGTIKLIADLRAAIPDLAIRTTMLVGYPGETEADFEELKEFVREAKFERLGVFTYSAEEGTYSAEKLTDDVPDDVKQARADEIMQLQSAISYNYNASREGRVERVIVDGKVDGRWVARSQYDSPEVDTEIEIITEKRLRRGCFYNVRIVEADEYDLVAELI